MSARIKPRRAAKKPMDVLLSALMYGAAGLAFAMLLYLVAHILIRGVPHLRPSLFALKYTSNNVSMLPALINTVSMTLLALVVAVPLGVCTAIYLVEYARKGSRVVRVIRTTAETLSGIPSIVYGLFGLLFFVAFVGWGQSLLAGAFTLAIMILPLIMRTTEEALRAVPDSFREGSFGLGAGRLRTIAVILLPSAMPGILAGVILAIGRIVGETAALIYTGGTATKLAGSPLASGRTLAIHMWALSSEGLHTDEAYATAVVLLALVVGINTLSAFLAKKITKR
jgi:phosphate transport system permease protein